VCFYIHLYAYTSVYTHAPHSRRKGRGLTLLIYSHSNTHRSCRKHVLPSHARLSCSAKHVWPELMCEYRTSTVTAQTKFIYTCTTIARQVFLCKLKYTVATHSFLKYNWDEIFRWEAIGLVSFEIFYHSRFPPNTPSVFIYMQGLVYVEYLKQQTVYVITKIYWSKFHQIYY
jgi:hypothetical protein